ncbi:MAG TPA: DUF3857 domain-containing protein [Acidobacteriaceae bacterium]|nr:DUF3857 domain-containing protein [Acidobacteriaceae bacterium]
MTAQSPRRPLMRSSKAPEILRAAALLALALAPAAAYSSDNWMKPTQEELSMTSLPGYAGAAAVVLYREEITKDDLHVVQHYDRIKILTDEGKKYANVELGYVSTSTTWDNNGDGKSLDEISGRTIHPDGTIVPFTGKPYLKVLEKERGVKVQEKVFSLPDVSVGSIIEYRYNTRINDNIFEAPDWIIQGDLYLKSAHYTWYPTSHELVDEKQRAINAISWFPILPPGAKIETRESPGGSGFSASRRTYDLVVHDVPPQTKEDHMPPIASYSYRVLFNFTPYRTIDDYWKSEGKDWSKHVNSFANPNSDLKAATQTIIAGANTQDEKLHKIYAAVMKLENSDFTREHDKREDKANGVSKINNADDIWKNQRGSSTQLTELFVSMARAAGLEADMMLVPDRSRELFTPAWLTFRQFDDVIAIVNVDGNEKFFDPGSRFCSYGHLAWEHTFVQGLRQKGNETTTAQTPGEEYRTNHVTRVANLTLDEKGELTGKIDLTFTGSPALHWRQAALRGDEESLKHDLRVYLEDLLPRTLEVKSVEVHNSDDYEHPLLVNYTVAGTMGTWMGKRLMMPSDIFLANAKATFPHEKRELGVYFHYPEYVQDAQRVNFPPSFAVEGAPAPAKFNMAQFGAYTMTTAQGATNYTTRRDFAFNDIYVLPKGYGELRSFYSQFESNDQQTIVLKTNPGVTSSATASGGK